MARKHKVVHLYITTRQMEALDFLHTYRRYGVMRGVFHGRVENILIARGLVEVRVNKKRNNEQRLFLTEAGELLRTLK